MSAGVIAIFAVLVLAASAFAAWPTLARARGRARWLPVAALALFVTGIGVGFYLIVGRPALAVRALEGDKVHDLNGAIAATVRHLRTAPGDLRGWRLLGRAYLDAGDGENALRAFVRAIQVARATGKESAAVYSDYGLALASTTPGGAVTDEAERAFNVALTLDPNDRAALYFLGLASAARGRNAQAMAMWQKLLGELPARSEFRAELQKRMAALGAGPPDVGAMVASLAARMKARPDDAKGWQLLIRSYVVMKDEAKARTALADARAALAKNPQALKDIAAEAKALGLEN
jgi:cytochrome c-type biogenesis protein CcmH